MEVVAAAAAAAAAEVSAKLAQPFTKLNIITAITETDILHQLQQLSVH